MQLQVHKAKLTVRSEGLLEMPVAVKTILLDEDSGARVQRVSQVVSYDRMHSVLQRQ